MARDDTPRATRAHQPIAAAVTGLVFLVLAIAGLGALLYLQLPGLDTTSPLAVPTVLATAVLVPIAFVLLLMLIVKLANVARFNSLGRQYPGAYLAHLVIDGTTKWQLRAAAATVDGQKARIGGGYATLVADPQSLRVYRSAERVGVRLPMTALVAASTEDREIRSRSLTAMTLTFEGPHGRVEVDLVPYDYRGLFARAMQGSGVGRELQRLGDATRPVDQRGTSAPAPEPWD